MDHANRSRDSVHDNHVPSMECITSFFRRRRIRTDSPVTSFWARLDEPIWLGENDTAHKLGSWTMGTQWRGKPRNMPS